MQIRVAEHGYSHVFIYTDQCKVNHRENYDESYIGDYLEYETGRDENEPVDAYWVQNLDEWYLEPVEGNEEKIRKFIALGRLKYPQFPFRIWEVGK